MLRTVLRQLIWGVVTLLLLSMLLFLLTALMPGNYFDMAASGKKITPQAVEQMQAQFYMDKPSLSRYFYWLRDLAHLDLGVSLIYKKPVTNLIASYLPNTLLLTGIAFVLEIILGLSLSIYAGCRSKKRKPRLDPIWIIFICLPSFLFCIFLQWFFGAKLGILPMMGLSDYGSSSVLDRILHLILPCTALAVPEGIRLYSYLYSRLEPTLQQDYICLERAKGKSRLRAVCTVALPNSISPLISYIGMSFPYLFSGSVVVETLFSIPGLGMLGYQAVMQRDYPLIMACTMLMAAAAIVGRILSNILYPLFDPRISAEGSAL